MKFLFRILIAFLIFSSTKLFAQDPQFTQFYASPLYLNPAFAGSIKCPRLVMNFRDQWPMITGTFVTYAASYDQHIDVVEGGVGLLFVNDRAGEGTVTTTSGSLLYSYHFPITRKFSIRAGLQASLYQKKLDWSKLTFPDMIDARYGFIYQTAEKPNELKRSYVDFSSGLIGYSDQVFFGFACHHLFQPSEGFVIVADGPLPRKYTAHAGGKIPLGRRMGVRRRGVENNISPNILYQRQQDFNQLNYGIYVQKNAFIVGGWFRQGFNNPDAFMLLIGVQQSGFKFGYNYDLTVSKLSNATGGSHEISITLDFPCRSKSRSRNLRALSCPSF